MDAMVAFVMIDWANLIPKICEGTDLKLTRKEVYIDLGVGKRRQADRVHRGHGLGIQVGGNMIDMDGATGYNDRGKLIGGRA